MNMIVSKDDALIFLHQVKCDLKIRNKQWLDQIEKDLNSLDVIINRISEADIQQLNLATLVVSLLHSFRADLMRDTQVEFINEFEKATENEKP